MSRSKKSRTRSKIIAASLFFAFFAFVAGLLLWPTSNETLVVSRSLSIREGAEAADSFTYSAPGINVEMAAGCNVPATFKLQITSIRSRGRLRIYINDFYVGYADITSTGEAMITSGCGCGTSCICTIKSGQNTVKFSGEGFVGEIRYEIYVKK